MALRETKNSDRFDDIVDALYTMPPARFIAARDERGAQARGVGDNALAVELAKLRRPTTAAWAVNLLVRRERKQLDRLLALGAELVQAQQELQGDQLRQLNRQRHQVISALARQARVLAAKEGQPLGDDAALQVEQTLIAALSDARAAEEVRGGRLTRALEYTGFGPPPTEIPEPAHPANELSTVDGVAEQRRRKLERQLDEAHHELEDTRASFNDAEKQEREAKAERERANRRVAELRQELEAAQGSLVEAERSLVEAEHRVTTARERSAAAHARHDALRERIEQLAEQLRPK